MEKKEAVREWCFNAATGIENSRDAANVAPLDKRIEQIIKAAKEIENYISSEPEQQRATKSWYG